MTVVSVTQTQLFRHTRIYARALSSLVPRLAWCHTFRLEADCVLGSGDRLGRLVLRSGDPIFPARTLPTYDSKLEEHFAAAFGKPAPEWDVIRASLRAAKLDRLILCIDAERCCTEDALEVSAFVARYRRNLDCSRRV